MKIGTVLILKSLSVLLANQIVLIRLIAFGKNIGKDSVLDKDMKKAGDHIVNTIREITEVVSRHGNQEETH